MRHVRLELPTGQRVTAQQVLIGVALLELVASNDMAVSSPNPEVCESDKEYGVIKRLRVEPFIFKDKSMVLNQIFLIC